MKVLVTGAAGYIGSAVCWKLLERSHEVVGLDSLKYGERDSLPADLPFIQCDLAATDMLALSFGMRQSGIEAVCHLAAESLIPLSFEEPDLFWRVNVVAGLRLLDAMRGADVHRILYSSTSSVYADNQPVPLTEQSAIGPSSCYGASKLAFELALPWMLDLSWVAFRYFNVCGATEHVYERPYHRSRIIPVALDVARGRLPSMSLNGTDHPTPDGTCVRDYLHVDDVAEAHVLALEYPDLQGVFNLGIGRGYSNREVIETAQRVTGREIKTIDQPRRPGDPAELVADPTKFVTAGWQPRYTSLEEMIASAWRYEP